jgi:hypothetical protein
MLAATLFLSLSWFAQAEQEAVSFQREVLPILSDRCFSCHGPDATERDSELRFDLRESVFGDLGGYSAVVPGHPEESELIDRITTRFEDDRMPPIDSNLALTASEIDTLRRWIAEGADWEEHWAFVPPKKPTASKPSDPSWARTGIDPFVLARLEANGLGPNRSAEPATWLRRVTLDLTGLPPTPSELRAFLADPSEAAYAAVVERLLASPRYGERMAWEWLDTARYADTDGFQADPTRQMWPWRDWLVDQLNANKPFDQLTLEMLAGDLLPDASPEQVLASGFNRNHMTNGEGGRIFEETRVENVFDRVETTATTWLGLTFTCARCHDHRYDPISQREYYQLFDFFNQTSDTGRGGQGRSTPNMRYLSPELRSRMVAIDVEVQSLENERRKPNAQLDAAQEAWEAQQRERLQDQPSAAQPTAIEGGWWKSAVPFVGPTDEMYATAYPPEAGVELDNPELWVPAPELKEGEPLLFGQVLGAHYYFNRLVAASARQIELSLGSDDAIKVFLNGAEVFGNDVRRGVAADQERITIDLHQGSNDLLIKIVNTGGNGGIYFRRGVETVDGMPLTLVASLQRAPAERSPEQADQLKRFYRERFSKPWRAAQEQITALQAERASLQEDTPVVLVMDSLPMNRQRETRVLDRGGYDQPRELVHADTPAFLPPLRAAGGGDADPGSLIEGSSADGKPAPVTRLDLATWLLDPQHPLTARVTVNREWQRFFGTGLVASSEDFGRQGELPSHPQLLDFLAVRFIETGWDLKQLHRDIVLSATYRQSSIAPTQAYLDDPDNRMLARGPRFRLPSSMIRDQALALAGLLVEQQGGPPVRPYQPDGVWAEATFDTIRYQQDAGDSLYRRSLYVFWRRIVQPTFFFDTAKRQVCSVRPNLTNSPLHALVTQNDPAYVEAARCFAQRALTEGMAPFAEIDEFGAVETGMRWAFRLATAREMRDEEQALLVDRWLALVEHYRAHPEAALALISVGESPFHPELPPAELAAMSVVCSIILNLDEVLTKS